jgi:hypothetical protein
VVRVNDHEIFNMRACLTGRNGPKVVGDKAAQVAGVEAFDIRVTSVGQSAHHASHVLELPDRAMLATNSPPGRLNTQGVTQLRRSNAALSRIKRQRQAQRRPATPGQIARSFEFALHAGVSSLGSR